VPITGGPGARLYVPGPALMKLVMLKVFTVSQEQGQADSARRVIDTHLNARSLH